jgi:hypothetical protein
MLGVAALLVVTRTRASAPAGRYTIPGNGTVLDTKTGLTWQQVNAGSGMTQTAALTYCSGNSASLPGNGWRLPTVAELTTLVDYSQPSSTSVAMIDPTAFPNTPATFFWSATPAAGSPGNAWPVDFSAGLLEWLGVGVVSSSSFMVRCVR